jgi:thiamine-monophosphate kinase
MRISDLGEFNLIERLAAILAGGEVQPAGGAVGLGIGDDAAVLAVPEGREVVATADALVEEVHFRRDWTGPGDLGWKALAVNVSDVGAMGAAPLAALICAALPPELEVEWVEALYQGLRECAAAYGCPVVGGDTVRSAGGIMLSVTALGSLPAGRAVIRAGARTADLLCVTGTLGDSAAGLALLHAGETPQSRPEYAPLFAAHRRPRPPVAAALALAGTGVRGMLDLSDGLASDLQRLAAASGTGARVEEERLPISFLARRAADELGVMPEEWALRGGEDYEYLFTVPPERFPSLPPLLGPLGVTATIIGEVRREGLVLAQADGTETTLPPPGFAHFGNTGRR